MTMVDNDEAFSKHCRKLEREGGEHGEKRNMVCMTWESHMSMSVSML